MKRKHLLGNRIFMALVFVFLYAPIFILIIFSFNAGNSSAVWKGFSLHWYAELFQNRLIMQSVYTTLLVSVLSTLIATVAGTCAAIGLASMRRRWRTPLMTVNNIPVMNAEIVTGVSMCLLFVAFFGLWKAFAVWFNQAQDTFWMEENIYLGFGTLLLAHVTFNIPHVILTVMPKLRQMDKNLVDAGLLEGHYPGDQARHHLRRTDRLHHEHRRFHHQLLHRRFRRVHSGHDHLFHDEKAGQPGDQCHFHAALRRCAAAAHHHQCPGIPAGAPAGASPRMTIGPTACGS